MRLIFAGTPEFAARALQALLQAGHEVVLVLTQPDRGSGRGLKSVPSAVKALAIARGLEVFQPPRLDDAQTRERLSALDADAMIVAAYGLILPEAILQATRLGAINIHASLLPRWRGAAPIQRAILAGDTRSGISIMQMDRGLDTGPVFAAEPVEIAAEETGGTLHDKLADVGARLIVQVLAGRDRGGPGAQPQPATGASYAAKIAKAEAQIDWREPATAIDRKIRAFNPHPGAFTSIRGVAVKIWRSQIVPLEGAAGVVLEAGPKDFVVACGAGSLRILELQRAGGRKLGSAQFLAGFSVDPGERLEFSAEDVI